MRLVLTKARHGLEKWPGRLTGEAPFPEGDPLEKAAQVNPPREFSSTQVNLPPSLAKRVLALAARIPDKDLAEDGREEEPHVTVKFGLHTNNSKDVLRLLRNQPPARLRVGGASVFLASETGGDYDVVKLDVESDDLHHLNALIADNFPCTDTHPEYKPHITVAYVRPGLGEGYARNMHLSGEVTVNEVVFSGKNRVKTVIPLDGKRLGLRKAMGKPPEQDDEGPFEALETVDIWVSGQNGARYRAKYHPPSGKILVLALDGRPLKKAWDHLLWYAVDAWVIAKALPDWVKSQKEFRERGSETPAYSSIHHALSGGLQRTNGNGTLVLKDGSRVRTNPISRHISHDGGILGGDGNIYHHSSVREVRDNNNVLLWHHTLSKAKATVSHEPHEWKVSVGSEGLPEHFRGHDTIHARVFHPQTGKRIGIAQFKDLGERRLHPESVHVEMEHRRQGVATAIYRHMEDALGYKIIRQPSLTREGRLFRNAYDKQRVSKAAHFTPEEIKTMGLRWITAHPDGPDSEGVPILVHDDGKHYTVVGGAGGRLNQMVLKKPGQHQAEDKARAKAEGKKVKEENPALTPEERKPFEEKRAILHAKEKEALTRIDALVRKHLGKDSSVEEIVPKIEAEAKRRAKEEHPGATEEEVGEFEEQAVRQARKAHAQDIKAAGVKMFNAAAEHEAMRQLGGGVDDDELTPAEFRARVSGVNIVRKLPRHAIEEILGLQMGLSETRKAKRAVDKALRTGKKAALDGIEAAMERLDPTEGQVAEWAAKGYYERQSTLAHTGLVKESLAASAQTQAQHQAGGAADTLNTITGGVAGKAVLGTEAVKLLGVENAGRVAAAWLASQGLATPEQGEALRDEMALNGYEDAVSALDQNAEQRAIATTAKRFADEGDGTVTQSQASIMAANAAKAGYRRANAARGRLRGAQAAAQALVNPTDAPMSLDGGETVVEAHSRAAGLGLSEGDYEVENPKKNSYLLAVKPDAVPKLADPRSVKDAERSQVMDEVRAFADEHWHDYVPEGVNPDVRFENANGSVWKGPHQVEAIEALRRNKRVLGAHGAGSGKTSEQMASAAVLLSSGVAQKGILIVPTGVRSKTEAEARHFLTPEMAAKTIVVDSGTALKRALKDPSKQMIVLTSDLIRNHAQTLLDAGHGQEGTFVLADEAHQLAVGEGDKGAQRSHAVRRLLKGAEYVGLYTGTPLENNASELYSLVDMLTPEGEQNPLGSMKGFSQEAERQAEQGGFLSGPASARVKDRLSGVMSSFFEPPKRAGSGGEDLKVNKETHTTPVAPGQRKKIAAINRDYIEQKNSDNPDVRKGASFTRYGRTMGVLARGSEDPSSQDFNPKMAELAKIAEDARQRDPASKIAIVSDTLPPLADAQVVLAKHGETVRITGAEDDDAMREAQRKLAQDPNVIGAVVSTQKGGTGINLQAANVSVSLHSHATPSSETQWIAREAREGQTRDVDYHQFLSEHPVEQMLAFRKEQKGKILDWVMRLARRGDESGRAAILSMDPETLERAAGLRKALRMRRLLCLPQKHR